MGTHGHIHMEIAIGAAIAACVAMSGDIQHLLVVDTGGNGDFHRLLAADASGTVTIFTGSFNYLTGTVAAVTPTGGLYHSEGSPLADAYLTGTAALRAGLGLGALGGAAAAAALTGFNLPVSNFFFASLGGFLKGNRHHGFGIAAAAGCIWIGTASAAAKTAAEEAVENVAKIHAHTAGEGASAACTAAEVRVNACMAELVITGALIFIGQHFIGFVDFLELRLGLFIAGVQVGMVFFGQLTVGLFDFIIRGILGNSHDLIIISFISHFYPFLSHKQRGFPPPNLRLHRLSGELFTQSMGQQMPPRAQ